MKLRELLEQVKGYDPETRILIATENNLRSMQELESISYHGGDKSLNIDIPYDPTIPLFNRTSSYWVSQEEREADAYWLHEREAMFGAYYHDLPNEPHYLAYDAVAEVYGLFEMKELHNLPDEAKQAFLDSMSQTTAEVELYLKHTWYAHEGMLQHFQAKIQQLEHLLNRMECLRDGEDIDMEAVYARHAAALDVYRAAAYCVERRLHAFYQRYDRAKPEILGNYHVQMGDPSKAENNRTLAFFDGDDFGQLLPNHTEWTVT